MNKKALMEIAAALEKDNKHIAMTIPCGGARKSKRMLLGKAVKSNAVYAVSKDKRTKEQKELDRLDKGESEKPEEIIA